MKRKIPLDTGSGKKPQPHRQVFWGEKPLNKQQKARQVCFLVKVSLGCNVGEKLKLYLEGNSFLKEHCCK